MENQDNLWKFGAFCCIVG